MSPLRSVGFAASAMLRPLGGAFSTTAVRLYTHCIEDSIDKLKRGIIQGRNTVSTNLNE